MYAELIYTRCRQGIDMLNNGRPITSDGYKVYSCTSSILKDGNTDLQLLLNAAQTKQSYNDPSFMDDAYLYFVPDKGDSFMINFYPVPYDPNAKGDYSHRAGNFINHILIGDYSGFYPFELFRDRDVWNAKTRGEAFYYENAPTDSPARTDIDDPAGQFGIEEIRAFISDGRKEALMSAVSFLIAQYGLAPEDRKFLVIRDESSEKIEMWIAAIEHVFSPRMASAIPFATRMDKFATANRYTVNQMGVYQTQINLQDHNQKLRYRAMIVGVDERDRTNAAAAHPLANSPFVMLDGKEKRATFEADTSNRYFCFITSFNDAHQSFCREFLQMINITAPSAEIFRLFDIYMILENPLLPNAKEMTKIVADLGKYSLFNSSKLQNLYNRITAELPRFLQDDPRNALQIIKWLQMVSRIVNDVDATNKLSDIVCKVFTEQVYRKSDSDGTFDFWQNIKNSEFAASVSEYFIAPATLQANQTYLLQLNFSDAITFVHIYLDCAAFLGTVKEQKIENIVAWGLKKCYEQKDTDTARKILKSISQNHRVDVQDMLVSIARGSESDYAEFIVKFLIEYDESIVSSDASIQAFLKKLSAAGMEHFFVAVLKFRIRSLTKPADIEQFVKLAKKIQPLSDNDLAEIFEKLDSRLVMTEKGSTNAASIIQQEKPRGAKCVNSAHLYALEILDDSNKRAQFTDIYNDLSKQGFPAVSNPDYIRTLIEKLFKAQMTKNELEYIVRLFAPVPAYITKLISTILGMTKPKRNDEWNVLIAVAAKMPNRAVHDTIIEECTKLKRDEKALSQLSDMLELRENREFFRHMAEKVKEKIRSQKPQSSFGRLFGNIFSRDGNKKTKSEVRKSHE